MLYKKLKDLSTTRIATLLSLQNKCDFSVVDVDEIEMRKIVCDEKT